MPRLTTRRLPRPRAVLSNYRVIAYRNTTTRLITRFPLLELTMLELTQYLGLTMYWWWIKRQAMPLFTMVALTQTVFGRC